MNNMIWLMRAARWVRNPPSAGRVKLVIAILIFVMVFIPWRRKREDVNRGHFIGIIALTLINAAVATFWH